MQKRQEIDELLRRHSMLSPIELCGLHWVPANKPIEWYLGFVQCLEIHRGIRELFAEKKQSEAYEILGKRIQEELAKFAENGGDGSV
jgi:hypothetical protein